MTSLRDLSEELRSIAELASNPDIPAEALADTIEGLEGMFTDKVIRVTHVIANVESDITAVDTEIKRLQARKKTMENGRDRMKDYLRMNMEATNTKKVESDLFTITLLPPPRVVVINDEDAIPEAFKKEKVTYSVQKDAIKDALKGGAEVPGAELGDGTAGLRIR